MDRSADRVHTCQYPGCPEDTHDGNPGFCSYRHRDAMSRPLRNGPGPPVTEVRRCAYTGCASVEEERCLYPATPVVESPALVAAAPTSVPAVTEIATVGLPVGPNVHFLDVKKGAARDKPTAESSESSEIDGPPLRRRPPPQKHPKIEEKTRLQKNMFFFKNYPKVSWNGEEGEYCTRSHRALGQRPPSQA